MQCKGCAHAYYPVPKEWNDDTVQLNFSGLRHDVDGKIWTKTVGTQHIFRTDLKTGKWERFHPADFLPKETAPARASVYQVISDSQNNLWMAEFQAGHIGKIDAKTTEIKWWAVPTKNARARRLNIDDQDRLTFTEYRGNKVGVFDTRTEKFTEYDLPPRTYPYRANFDKNGEIWGVDHAHRPGRAAQSQDRKHGAIPDAVRHQHAHGVCRQLDHAGDLLGRQQPRPPHRQGRDARLAGRLDVVRPDDLAPAFHLALEERVDCL